MDSIVLHVELLEHGEAVCSCSAVVRAERAHQQGAAAQNVADDDEDSIELVTLQLVQLCCSGDSQSNACELAFGSSGQLFEIRSFSSGLEADRKLRQQQLVHADGCLHLKLRLAYPWVA
jgi:hypothetical protein